MRVIHDPWLKDVVEAPLQNGVITIGDFDGCHFGHQSLFRTTQELAQKHASLVLAMTFEPSPKIFFGAKNSPLFSPQLKNQAFEQIGIDIHLIQTFDETFSHISREDFFSGLIERFQPVAIVVGSDFHFGYRRQGNASWLGEQAHTAGITFIQLDPLNEGNNKVSSSTIRQQIERGQIEEATKLLGRPYLLEGKVIKGAQQGKAIGFPTANLGQCSQCLPSDGVYAGYGIVTPSSPLKVPQNAPRVVISVSQRPTFTDQGPLQIEGHWLEGEAPSYGDNIGYFFCRRLRDNKKFSDVEQLKQQIKQDIELAKRIPL